jgi:hypothetical protein
VHIEVATENASHPAKAALVISAPAAAPAVAAVAAGGARCSLDDAAAVAVAAAAVDVVAAAAVAAAVVAVDVVAALVVAAAVGAIAAVAAAVASAYVVYHHYACALLMILMKVPQQQELHSPESTAALSAPLELAVAALLETARPLLFPAVAAAAVAAVDGCVDAAALSAFAGATDDHAASDAGLSYDQWSECQRYRYRYWQCLRSGASHAFHDCLCSSALT